MLFGSKWLLPGIEVNALAYMLNDLKILFPQAIKPRASIFGMSLNRSRQYLLILCRWCHKCLLRGSQVRTLAYMMKTVFNFVIDQNHNARNFIFGM